MPYDPANPLLERVRWAADLRATAERELQDAIVDATGKCRQEDIADAARTSRPTVRLLRAKADEARRLDAMPTTVTPPSPTQSGSTDSDENGPVVDLAADTAR